MASLSAREQAYQTIRSRIITMELKPGDPLNDRELAEQMGISRTPMRIKYTRKKHQNLSKRQLPI